MFLTKAESKKLLKLGLCTLKDGEALSEYRFFFKKRLPFSTFSNYLREPRCIATLSQSDGYCNFVPGQVMWTSYYYYVNYYLMEEGREVTYFKVHDSFEEVVNFLSHMLKKDKSNK